MAELVLMTLAEFALSLGLTVPQILARAVQVDPSFVCADPGSQLLNSGSEAKLRELLSDASEPVEAKPDTKLSRKAQRTKKQADSQFGISRQSNRSISALAAEYGIDPIELKKVAISLGYSFPRNSEKLSIAQVNRLLLHLNESTERSYGDANSNTIAGALKNAGKLRDQPQSLKIRPSPNLRRTRLEVLTAQWGPSVVVLSDMCRLVRIMIHDPETPRIANDDLLKLRAALQASVFATERWGAQSDVRLSKITSHCRVSLADLRKQCVSLGIEILKRDRICRDDAVYLLVEIESLRQQRSEVVSVEVLKTEANPTASAAATDSRLELRLDDLVLTDQDFSFAVLSDASFRGCELTRANFTGANLTGADFSGAILRYAVFEHTILENAVFDKADVRFAKFGGAVIAAGQLMSAISNGAEFEGGERL